MGFEYREGYLYCENVCLKDLQEQLKDSGIFPDSPVFVYSKDLILKNVKSYQQALNSLPNDTGLNFSVKANTNPHLLRILRDEGCSVTLVSGNELRLALQVGFTPSQMVLNGNGKCRWETRLALETGCLINVDSEFDLKQTIEVSKEFNLEARVLLRINLNIDAHVHPYISTGMAGSKFGIDEEQLGHVMDLIKTENHIKVFGLHCHLGSTIQDLTAIRLCLKKLKTKLDESIDIKYINIGGGLNINYMEHVDDTQCIDHEDDQILKQVEGKLKDLPSNGFKIDHQKYKNKQINRRDWIKKLKEHDMLPDCIPENTTPSIKDLISTVEETGFHHSIKIIVEPGRSIVGNTAVLLSSVLGCKTSGNIRFIVTTGSMTEVLRPSLYDAYHHIDFTEPVEDSTRHLYNVVGPVCESTDFLGKDRFLKTPHEGCGVAVWDVGAYCSSMSSNYNCRVRPAEILVDGSSWKIIRKPDSYEDMMSAYEYQQ
ncbi:hypothetical protein SNE40_009340 [Patella caerulea]|uniref:Orn/DAP/Arg decarboxylase 2 N-terminal domain-containing protein n=1 Tax=Patella caerulea TaxID=87958 RepID=A0AAN8JNP2_PATCE